MAVAKANTYIEQINEYEYEMEDQRNHGLLYGLLYRIYRFFFPSVFVDKRQKREELKANGISNKESAKRGILLTAFTATSTVISNILSAGNGAGFLKAADKVVLPFIGNVLTYFLPIDLVAGTATGVIIHKASAYRKANGQLKLNAKVHEGIEKVGTAKTNEKRRENVKNVEEKITKQYAGDSYSKIIKNRFFNPINSFMQVILNKTDFRDLKNGNNLSKVVELSDGTKIIADYSFSRVYDALKVLAKNNIQIPDSVDNYNNLIEQTKIEKKNKISVALSILKNLEEAGVEYRKYNSLVVPNTANGYINFAEYIGEGKLLEEITSNIENRTNGAWTKEKLQNRANEILAEIDELHMTPEEKKDIYHEYNIGIDPIVYYGKKPFIKKIKNVVAKKRYFEISKETMQSCERIAAEQTAKETQLNLKYNFIDENWARGILLSKSNDKIIRSYKDVILQIANSNGKVYSRRDFKRLLENITEENVDEIVSNKNMIQQLEKVRNGISVNNYGSTDEEFYLTRRFKLKKVNGKKKSKTIRWSSPYYKKSGFWYNFMPLTRKFIGKNAGTIVLSAIGASLILASGLGGIVGFTLAGVSATIANITGIALLATSALNVARKFVNFITGGKVTLLASKKTREANKKFREEEKSARLLANPSAMVSDKFAKETAKFMTNKKILFFFRNKYFKAEKEEFFTKFNNEATEDEITLSKNFAKAFGLTNKFQNTIKKMVEVNRDIMVNGLMHNSRVRFLKKPIEIYVRDKKGNIKATLTFSQRWMFEQAVLAIMKDIKENDVADSIEITSRDVLPVKISKSQIEAETKNNEKAYIKILKNTKQHVKEEEERRETFGIIKHFIKKEKKDSGKYVIKNEAAFKKMFTDKLKFNLESGTQEEWRIAIFNAANRAITRQNSVIYDLNKREKNDKRHVAPIDYIGISDGDIARAENSKQNSKPANVKPENIKEEEIVYPNKNTRSKGNEFNEIYFNSFNVMLDNKDVENENFNLSDNQQPVPTNINERPQKNMPQNNATIQKKTNEMNNLMNLISKSFSASLKIGNTNLKIAEYNIKNKKDVENMKKILDDTLGKLLNEPTSVITLNKNKLEKIIYRLDEINNNYNEIENNLKTDTKNNLSEIMSKIQELKKQASVLLDTKNKRNLKRD